MHLWLGHAFNSEWPWPQAKCSDVCVHRWKPVLKYHFRSEKRLTPWIFVLPSVVIYLSPTFCFTWRVSEVLLKEKLVCKCGQECWGLLRASVSTICIASNMKKQLNNEGKLLLLSVGAGHWIIISSPFPLQCGCGEWAEQYPHTRDFGLRHVTCLANWILVDVTWEKVWNVLLWDTWAVALWDWHEKVRLQASY